MSWVASDFAGALVAQGRDTPGTLAFSFGAERLTRGFGQFLLAEAQQGTTYTQTLPDVNVDRIRCAFGFSHV